MTHVVSENATLDAARDYVRRGWCVVPIPLGQKRPILKGWERLRLTAAELAAHFQHPANIGLLLGEPSGGLVDVDLDCDEALALADQYLPPTAAITGRPQKPRSHRWYYAGSVDTKQHRDPHTRSMLIELRSTGGQTVVGPSLHPHGDPYDVLAGEPARVPGPMLAACVAALADRILELRYGSVSERPEIRLPAIPRQHATRDEIERRALAYLDKIPPAISGQGGHSVTYAAATILVHGFEIDPDRALDLLWQHYNPRCDPPWTEKELRHKVDDAANKSHRQPRGWLLTTSEPPVNVDVSAIVGQAVGGRWPVSGREVSKDTLPDPGTIPEELFRVPGFISEVMDLSLASAPYPNQPLAFCGALALQAFLAGRKVRDPADNRTNLYLLGLAYSASGKDWPRKVNTQIAHAVGLSHCLGETFASGEGLQDALFITSSMLFQTDEIDGLLQSINKAKDARYEGILSTLLTMYSASNSVVPMRRRAGQEAPGTIEQPCLVIYGTAIPTQYYAALSERMLTNGFFARMLIVEAAKRGAGQEPGIIQPSPRILETASYWANFQPGKGNLEKFYPIPKIVEYAPAARSLLIDARRSCEAEYTLAEAHGDPVGTTVWGRTNEHLRKLALLYAVSADHRNPRIDEDAVSWATQFAMSQTRRMLFMAQGHVAANPFHAECLKAIEKLRSAPRRSLSHSVLLKRMKMDAKSFERMMETLITQGDVEVATEATSGRPFRTYRMTEEQPLSPREGSGETGERSHPAGGERG